MEECRGPDLRQLLQDSVSAKLSKPRSASKHYVGKYYGPGTVAGGGGEAGFGSKRADVLRGASGASPAEGGDAQQDLDRESAQAGLCTDGGKAKNGKQEVVERVAAGLLSGEPMPLSSDDEAFRVDASSLDDREDNFSRSGDETIAAAPEDENHPIRPRGLNIKVADVASKVMHAMERTLAMFVGAPGDTHGRPTHMRQMLSYMDDYGGRSNGSSDHASLETALQRGDAGENELPVLAVGTLVPQEESTASVFSAGTPERVPLQENGGTSSLAALEGGGDDSAEKMRPQKLEPPPNKLRTSTTTTATGFGAWSGNPIISLEFLRDCMRMMSEAVEQIHAAGVLHRDLKVENFRFRDADLRELVLLDFGLASLSPAGKAKGVGSDLWALGTIFYELIAGATPFDVGSLEMLQDLHKDPVLWQEDGRILLGRSARESRYWKRAGNRAQDLVTRLLRIPLDRRVASAGKVLQHAFFRSSTGRAGGRGAAASGGYEGNKYGSARGLIMNGGPARNDVETREPTGRRSRIEVLSSISRAAGAAVAALVRGVLHGDKRRPMVVSRSSSYDPRTRRQRTADFVREVVADCNAHYKSVEVPSVADEVVVDGVFHLEAAHRELNRLHFGLVGFV
eukprot:g5866.t1